MTVDNVRVDPDVRASRRLSKFLFGGAQYRIEVMVKIHQQGVVNAKEVADQLHISAQSVHQELRNLGRAGLITRESEGRSVYYRKVDSPIWKAVSALHDNAAAHREQAQEFDG